MNSSGNYVSAKAFNRMLAVAYVLFLYYLNLIVQAGLTTLFYVFASLFYLVGKSWRDVNDTLYGLHERFIIFISITLRGIKLNLYGDFGQVLDRQENIFVICNHQVDADYFLMAAAIEKTGSLSRLRHVMKESLIWFPYVGAYLINHNSIFINRSMLNWQKFDENCARLSASKTPSSVLIYPEGTTWNNASENERIFQKSDALARANKQEPFKHVMFPRHRGFCRLLSNLRSQTDAIYDLTFAYSSTRGPNGRLPAPGVIAFLNGECPEVHIHLKRIPIGDVPASEDDVRSLLIERFAEKNKLLGEFFRLGRFPQAGLQVPSRSFSDVFQSAALTVTAVCIGLSHYGLSLLPLYLLVPLLASYLNVIYHKFFT